jgi:hypothetical protein
MTRIFRRGLGQRKPKVIAPPGVAPGGGRQDRPGEKKRDSV